MSAGLAIRKCILIIGATSGIGRALALALASLPSKPTVIAAGRRQSRLDELKAQGLQGVALDLAGDEGSITKGIEGIIEAFPELDAVILCAGIQVEFDLDQPKAFSTANMLQELHVNYVANIIATNTILPHFQKLATRGIHTSLIPVTSSVMSCPVPWFPTYSASKAALHSYTISLQATFKDTNIHISELVPPLVESEINDSDPARREMLSKIWMPLADYIRLSMPGLLAGDLAVAVGQAADMYAKFNEGDKNPMADGLMEMRRGFKA